VAKQFTLGKEERLKSRKLIDQVFSDGKKFSLAPFRIHYLYIDHATGGNTILKFGAGVSTKIFKKAVDRNRVRRLTKEAWRLQKNLLKEKLPAKKQLSVFLVYTAKEIEGFHFLSEKIKKIIDKLLVAVNESK
jgi:ribonuclease P protein component